MVELFWNTNVRAHLYENPTGAVGAAPTTSKLLVPVESSTSTSFNDQYPFVEIGKRKRNVS